MLPAGLLAVLHQLPPWPILRSSSCTYKHKLHTLALAPSVARPLSACAAFSPSRALPKPRQRHPSSATAAAHAALPPLPPQPAAACRHRRRRAPLCVRARAVAQHASAAQHPASKSHWQVAGQCTAVGKVKIVCGVWWPGATCGAAMQDPLRQHPFIYRAGRGDVHRQLSLSALFSHSAVRNRAGRRRHGKRGRAFVAKTGRSRMHWIRWGRSRGSIYIHRFVINHRSHTPPFSAG